MPPALRSCDTRKWIPRVTKYGPMQTFGGTTTDNRLPGHSKLISKCGIAISQLWERCLAVKASRGFVNSWIRWPASVFTEMASGFYRSEKWEMIGLVWTDGV